MTRKEQIEKAADEKFDYGDLGDGASLYEGFVQGAEWADSTGYPTVHAYEQACKALENYKAKLEIAVEALEKAYSMMPGQCEEVTWPVITLRTALETIKEEHRK